MKQSKPRDSLPPAAAWAFVCVLINLFSYCFYNHLKLKLNQASALLELLEHEGKDKLRKLFFFSTVTVSNKPTMTDPVPFLMLRIKSF